VGPAGLVVGPQTVGGYGEGAADIGQAGKNRDFVAYKAREFKARTLAQNGHWFVDQFTHWQKSHPGLVRTALFYPDVAVVSVQTGWMCKRLLPEALIGDVASDVSNNLVAPVKGLITDAAHGYWSVGRHLLIVTSVFSAALGIWVPGLFTFADGATIQHYRYHFKGVFESICDQAQQQVLAVRDEMFVMVGDLTSSLNHC
jgi:hypothetical protein